MFDGVNDVVVVPASTYLDITGDVTIELWAKQTGFNPENMVVCKGAQDETVVFSMYFSEATFNCAFQDTNEAIVELGGPSFEDFQWHLHMFAKVTNILFMLMVLIVGGEHFPTYQQVVQSCL